MAVTAKRQCVVDGCEGKHLARGWCGTHYTRWCVYGTSDRELAWETKFWIYADVGHPTACWEWTKSKRRGYGRFHDSSGREMKAHIHLEPVTHAENLRRSPILSQWRENAQAKCAELECDNYGKLSRGLCPKHYQRVRSAERAKLPRPACDIEGCTNPAVAFKGGLCQKHTTRVFRHGDPHVNLNQV